MTIEELNNKIRVISDFPKEGIQFKDITTILNDSEAFQTIINIFYERYKDLEIDYVAGIESRGFIFGTPLALKLGVGFVPVRKIGKLPSKTVSVSYDLEYGSDTLEIHEDAFHGKNAKVLLIDDLLATGGTASATVQLIEKTGASVIESAFLIHLKFLGGEKKIKSPIFSIIEDN
jgi:adenine phosphoribosyltransferase